MHYLSRISEDDIKYVMKKSGKILFHIFQGM